MEDVTPLLSPWICVFHELSNQYESNLKRDASAISAKLAQKIPLMGTYYLLNRNHRSRQVTVFGGHNDAAVAISDDVDTYADDNVYKWKV